MIENFLIRSGFGCGTVKNFNTEIIKNMKLKNTDKWYFKTPLKISGVGLKTVTIDMAFPFQPEKDEMEEKEAITRLSPDLQCYEDSLIFFFRKNNLIVSDASFSFIPFWANESGTRNERKDFAQLRIHILNAVVTLKYRETWFNCSCN